MVETMMKKVILTALVMVMLTGVIGCDQWLDDWGCIEKPNYITVVVRAEVCVAVSDGKNPPNSIMWSGAQVRLESIKAGGETVSCEIATDSGGCATGDSAVFELYKEQPIKVIAKPIGGNLPGLVGGNTWDPSTYQVLNNVKTLQWSDIYPEHDFGDTFYWDPLISMLVEPYSY